jgi:hypothetical protein
MLHFTQSSTCLRPITDILCTYLQHLVCSLISFANALWRSSASRFASWVKLTASGVCRVKRYTNTRYLGTTSTARRCLTEKLVEAMYHYPFCDTTLTGSHCSICPPQRYPSRICGLIGRRDHRALLRFRAVLGACTGVLWHHQSWAQYTHLIRKAHHSSSSFQPRCSHRPFIQVAAFPSRKDVRKSSYFLRCQARNCFCARQRLFATAIYD